MEWQYIVALVIGIPIVILVPFLVWAAVVSGLYQVARDALRRRAHASQRRAASKTAEVPVPR